MMTLPAPDLTELQANRSKIVMVVDDLPENVLVLKAYVTAAGFTFISASSGEECLALTTRVVPRLILLDIEMGAGIDGIETCRRLRRSRELKAVPIVFLTVHRTADYVLAGMGAGGNDFIVKPVERLRLVERLTHWTARRV